MRIAVTGSTGLVGTALITHLRQRGDDVLRLVRRTPQTADEVRWDPQAGSVDEVPGLDVVVNLAGAGVGDRRWTPSYRALIRDSRVGATRTAGRLAVEHGAALVSASAVGWYGDRPGELLDERSAPDAGYLADVVVHWEAATQAARDAGVRVACARTGIVLSRDGGALGRLLPLVRAGLGGPLGRGDQVWPWITLDDEVRALTHLIDHDVDGRVNLVAPARTTQLELTRALAHALGRPAVLPAPAPALRLALGGFAGELLASQHVVPQRLLDAGFAFRHPALDDGVRAVLPHA